MCAAAVTTIHNTVRYKCLHFCTPALLFLALEVGSRYMLNVHTRGTAVATILTDIQHPG